MDEKQFCDVCKTEHSVNEFEHVSGGWITDTNRYGELVSHNWFTLKCLRTGKEFSIYYDETVSEEDD